MMDEQFLDRLLTLRNSHIPSPRMTLLPHSWYQRVLPAIDHIRGKMENKTWDAFWGVIVEGRSSTEIGKRLGLSAAGVRVGKSRVLRKLKTQLNSEN